ncbi:MAG TPA: HAD-IB family phosphatase [bacterium]|nr:HAD-IB family phosphatase [bacterium]
MELAQHFEPSVSRRLLSFLASASAGTLAAFDADGTLWSEDVGERFLRHAGEEGLLQKWPKGDAVWREYQKRHDAGDLRHAFELCVLAFEGMLDQEVAALAQTFVSPRWNDYVFPAMRELVAALRKADADIWIVSASPAWCVIPGAALLGVPESRVIAALPSVDDAGKVGATLRAPLPMQETKVEAIVARAGRPPHFAAGNSAYDYALLESARAMALLIDPPADNGWLTRRNGAAWLVQRFVSRAPAPVSGAAR